MQHLTGVQRLTVCCCTLLQVQVWDTQDEDSMDPLLNISDGFDAQVSTLASLGAQAADGCQRHAHTHSCLLDAVCAAYSLSVCSIA